MGQVRSSPQLISGQFFMEADSLYHVVMWFRMIMTVLMTIILASGWGWWCWPCLNTLVCGQSRERTRCNSWENPWKPAGTKKARPSAFFQKRSQTACPSSIVQFCAAKLVKPRVGANVIKADSSQHRQHLFSSTCTSRAREIFWPFCREFTHFWWSTERLTIAETNQMSYCETEVLTFLTNIWEKCASSHIFQCSIVVKYRYTLLW